jgi:mannose-6-phosphate isomerase-like protein (cupin superfamily)
MQCSRREVYFWIPALMASHGLGAEAPIPSKMLRFEDLPVQSGNGHTLRRILEGKTHSGYGVEMHETDLAPGAMPHPAHHHAHEEVFLVREGTLEVTITGRASRLGPGSVAYVASNEEHGIRNPGSTHAQYFVIALGTE